MHDLEKLVLRAKKEHGVDSNEFFNLGYKDGTQDAYKMSKNDINEFQRTDNSNQIDSFKRLASRQLIEIMKRQFGKVFKNIDDLSSTLNDDELYIYQYCVGWAHGVRTIWNKVKYMI